MAQDDYSKMLAPGAADDLHDGRDADIQMRPSARDHLPVALPQATFDVAPPLSPETLVCMADTSKFVTRGHFGEIESEFDPGDINLERTTQGDYFFRNKENFRVFVEPIRPRCKHYVQQMTDVTVDRTKRFFQRACSAIQTETGEFLSLRDGAMYACTLRSPPHFESELALEEFDRKLMTEGAEKVEMTAFDVDAELAKEALGVLGAK